ncbi:MAG: alpha/beta hydrolase [Oscillibacter sp.]|nr:alpha/beta hydrolase [Oscillibacter sp.]
MGKAVLYLHGKGGNAREADRYRDLCPGYEVFGLDYHGDTPWDTAAEIAGACAALARTHSGVVLIANSIGAYFAMHALQGENLARALFISPVVDMEKLILRMLAWSHRLEADLERQREIENGYGETLSWTYLQYVRAHPVSWTVPTHILYGENDNLTDLDTIRTFADRCGADLEVMPGGEHWFHTEEQMAFHDGWVRRHLS